MNVEAKIYMSICIIHKLLYPVDKKQTFAMIRNKNKGIKIKEMIYLK